MKKPVKKPSKMMEKRTGENYSSKSAMKRHERSESKSERMREYGRKGKR